MYGLPRCSLSTSPSVSGLEDFLRSVRSISRQRDTEGPVQRNGHAKAEDGS